MNFDINLPQKKKNTQLSSQAQFHNIAHHLSWISAIILQPWGKIYGVIDYKLMARISHLETVVLFYWTFYSGESSDQSVEMFLLQPHAFPLGCVCVFNMHSWFHQMLFGAQVSCSNSSKEKKITDRGEKRRQHKDMERKRKDCRKRGQFKTAAAWHTRKI